MRQYAETGERLGPLPAPGVYARHNAIGTPALLPDGSVAKDSVSRVLAARGSVRRTIPRDVEAVQRAIEPPPTARRTPRRAPDGRSTSSGRAPGASTGPDTTPEGGR